MSDPTPDPTPDDQGGQSGFTPPATQEELNRIIAERVTRERQKYADYNDLKTKAQKFAEFEESQKTELQRAIERAEAAEAKATQFESERQLTAWKSEVATAAEVPAEALRGSTKEELEAHAEVLKALIGGRRGPHVPNPGDTPQNKAEADELATVRSLFG